MAEAMDHPRQQLLRKELTQGGNSDDSDDSDCFAPHLFDTCKTLSKSMCGQELLVVFDMDHTMVGDLVSLSDRDNVETNMPWSW